ncbi:hypothetical protein ACHAWF_011880 [Thalassiosira exigua]
MYGHVHMAKTGGTSLNGMLANNFERVCGHKGNSNDAYQANESAKRKAAKGMSVAVAGNAKYGRDRVATKTLVETGFEDCDYVSHEAEHAFWIEHFGDERFHDVPMELHVPCRSPVDHLMSQCNHKLSLKQTKERFSCSESEEELKRSIDKCIVFISLRFSLELAEHFDVKCYDYEKQFTTYMDLMSQRLQPRRLVSSPYVPRESNKGRNKDEECIWYDEVAFERANRHLLETYDYYKFCNACMGSQNELTSHTVS